MVNSEKNIPEVGSASPFWSFSLEQYRKIDVEEACLAIQKRHNLNVNIILYFFWQASLTKGVLTTAQLSRLIGCISLWHDEVTVPIRRLRRRLKHLTDLEDSYDQFFRLELECEQIEQSFLATKGNSMEWLELSELDEVDQVLYHLHLFYREHHLHFDQVDYELLATLVRNIFPAFRVDAQTLISRLAITETRVALAQQKLNEEVLVSS